MIGDNQSTPNKSAGCNLADLIVQKINAWEATNTDGGATDLIEKKNKKNDEFEIPPKVVEVYSK